MRAKFYVSNIAKLDTLDSNTIEEGQTAPQEAREENNTYILYLLPLIGKNFKETQSLWDGEPQGQITLVGLNEKSVEGIKIGDEYALNLVKAK